jgi:predicted DNA-binding transcriptional regulator AlpA
MAHQLLRFKDLRERRIVDNRPTLQRWIAIEGFPPGRMLGPNTRAWTEEEIAEWITSRPTAISEKRCPHLPPKTKVVERYSGGLSTALAAPSL